MNLVFPISCTLGADEQRLVEKVRAAVSGTNYSLSHPLAKTGKIWVEAVIWKDPLRLDFQATDGDPVVAFLLNDQFDLTDDLFDGDKLKPEVLEELEASYEYFVRHMADPST